MPIYLVIIKVHSSFFHLLIVNWSILPKRRRQISASFLQNSLHTSFCTLTYNFMNISMSREKNVLWKQMYSDFSPITM